MNRAASKLVALAEKRPLTALAVFLLLTLGWFLHKAVHNDDALFVWTAERILKHPGDFYGFDVNWYGDTASMASINCNPPATSYFLAVIMAVFGGRELPLHAAMLGGALTAAAGIFQLAKAWCERPLLAAFVALSTPVFLVSATTLMCDVPLLAVWIWAMVFWERALKADRALDYFLASVLAGLAVLTKYSALTLLPLLPVLGVLRKRKAGWWLLWLVAPVAIIEGYQFWTAGLYGRGLISAAADYASQTRFAITGGGWNKIAIGLAYLGGCLLPVLLFIRRLWSGRELMVGGGLVLATAAAISFGSGLGRQFGFLFQLQMTLWSASGLHLLLLMLAGLWRRRDAVSGVLALWLGSGILFAAVLNWTVSARSFLPLAPVAAILVVRCLDRKCPGAETTPAFFLPVAVSAAVSLAVAAADCSLANSARTAARQITAAHPAGAGAVWFEGHGGFQFYYEKSGAQPLDFSSTVILPGEILVLPSNNSNLAPPQAGDVAALDVLEFPVCPWLGTVQAATGAGFYGAGGLLPFVFGPAPVEKYYVYRAARTLSFAPAESLNNQAWQLAANPNPQLRNGRQAVRLALGACALTQYQKTIYIGTLAAAQAEAGSFDEAIATAQRACAVAAANGETNLLRQNTELLSRYRAHQTAPE